MANKGTQALLVSDVSVLREAAAGQVELSVSATDVDGVRQLGLPVKTVLPSMVDIPYERADANARKLGLRRESLRYKCYAISSLFYMFLQVALSFASAAMFKVGLRGPYRSRELRCISEADVVVSCSDENFRESASMLPLNVYWVLTWWSMLVARTVEVLVVRLLGKPIVMFPNTVGPFRTRLGRVLARLALNCCSTVLVRESASYETLKSLAIRSRKILTSDTALLFNGLHDRSGEGVGAYARKIGVSPGVYSYTASEKEIQDYVMAHAKALDEAIERHGFSVVFLPHYITSFRYDDLEISRLILRRMKNSDKAQIVEVRDSKDFSLLMEPLSLIVSSKMHPAVLAASLYIPFLYVAYDYKQTGFAASLGMDECVLSFSEIGHGRLFAKIDEVWNERQRLRAALEKQIPEMRRQIRETITEVVRPYMKSGEAEEV